AGTGAGASGSPPGGAAGTSGVAGTSGTGGAGGAAGTGGAAGAAGAAGTGGAGGAVTQEAIVPVYRYVGPQDHLWTTDIREQATAAGYTWEGTTFHVYAKPPAAASRPIHRVRNGVGHIYTTDAAEHAALLAQGGIDETPLGHVATAAAPDLVPLLTSVRGDGLRLLTTSPVEQTAAAGLGFAPGPVAGFVPPTGPRAPDNPYTVGAYYFGMWSAQAFQSINGWPFGNRLFYGADRQDDWWLGVRDLHTKNCSVPGTSSPGFNAICQDDWSALAPAIGFYDLADVSTARKHIQQARQNGLGFFTFYWFWNTFTNREDVNDGLESFLQANVDDGMKFSLTICEHGGHLSMNQAQTLSTAKLIATKYLTRPSYLRTSSGQPIL
ncbi:MAG: hypothetical protein EOO75_19495, partial [Myxococcales bacterium]